MDQPWTPVLEGAAASRAREAIDGVARALGEPPASWRVGASLANGDAGLAVFYSYLASAEPGRGHDDVAARFIERAIETAATATLSSSLHHGFTGIAWATEHLIGRVIDPGDDDLNAAIDDALIEAVRTATTDFDLLTGLVGLGTYALERLPRPTARTILEVVVTQLAALAERSSAGLSWRTPPAMLDPDTTAQFPAGVFNLGLAHGVPGVIVLLAGAVAHGIAAARALLDDAVSWLLAQRFATGMDGWFPDLAGSPVPARLGWCYGDLSIAIALVLAARHAARPDWQLAAQSLAHDAAKRAGDRTGVRDACVCHGAAGLGLMFARLAHDGARRDPVLVAASRRWFETALDMHDPRDAVGGFAPFVIDTSLAPGDAAVGLLTGAAGVALALLAAITPTEPAWDRALLLSLHAV